MKIEVEYLNSVKPLFRGGGQQSTLRIDVELEPSQAEQLFYSLWEDYWTGGAFEEWIKAEGYALVKLKPNAKEDG